MYAVVGRGTFVRSADAIASQWQFLESPQKSGIELNINVPLKEDRAQMLSEAMGSLSRYPADMNQLLDYQPDIGVQAHRQIIA